MVGITVAVAVFPGRGGSQVVSTDPPAVVGERLFDVRLFHAMGRSD